MVIQAGGMSSSSSTWHSQSLPTIPFPVRWVAAVKALKFLICQVGKKKKIAGSLASLNRVPVTLRGSSQDVITQSIY